MLNYLYALLEAETTLACQAATLASGCSKPTAATEHRWRSMSWTLAVPRSTPTCSRCSRNAP
jgi:hypothetical protein